MYSVNNRIHIISQVLVLISLHGQRLCSVAKIRELLGVSYNIYAYMLL